VDAGARVLVGTVVDPAGEPVEDAWVALGTLSTKSGPAGEFALDLTAPGDPLRPAAPPAAALRAAKPGHLPAELARRPGEAWPDPLVLELGEPPLTIAGRVVDAAGEPVPFAEVWTSDEAHFGYIAIEGGEMAMRAGASVEGLLRGDPWTRRVSTDARGRFELRGLLPRDYRLHALERAQLRVAADTVAAGSLAVELCLPEEELRALAGCVTSLAGEPLAGYQVVLERPNADAPGSELDRLEGRPVETDAGGRFRFERVARAATRVRVSGPELGLTGFEHRLAPEDDPLDLVLAVPLRVHVQIDAGEAAVFERAALLDARGEPLTLSVHHGQSSYAMSEIPLEKGRSESFSVSELAETLVLYSGGKELRRMPLELARGGLNTIRP
jgi:protocatechuate 3,4-dioxygenase beta subunit